MQHHLQLSPQGNNSTPQKKAVKKYKHKAVEAAGYLHELFTDAIDYTPGQIQDIDGLLALEVRTGNGTVFTVDILFSHSELRLKPNFASGIIQTEVKKIRHFIEDLECYLNVAHQW